MLSPASLDSLSEKSISWVHFKSDRGSNVIKVRYDETSCYVQFDICQSGKDRRKFKVNL
jgi:hypothetical protein